MTRIGIKQEAALDLLELKPLFVAIHFDAEIARYSNVNTFYIFFKRGFINSKAGTRGKRIKQFFYILRYNAVKLKVLNQHFCDNTVSFNKYNGHR